MSRRLRPVEQAAVAGRSGAQIRVQTGASPEAAGAEIARLEPGRGRRNTNGPWEGAVGEGGEVLILLTRL